MLIFLVFVLFNYSMLFLLNFVLFFLVFLQLQKITSRRQADQKFSRRNNRSQEGRMCEGGPLPLHALFAQALNGILLCETLTALTAP